MLTPGYALTATERVLPRLALDFTTGVLDNRVTVTRALNTATRINSSGYIELVNADLPRFDYSPTSVGTPRGLLIEETRANLLLRSAEFNDNTAWTKNAATISLDAITAPDGTLTADKIEETSATASHYVSQSVTTTAVTHGFSCYVKAAERSFVLFWNPTVNFGRVFDVGTGVVSGTVAGVTQATAEITNAGNGWYRCTIYGTCTAASNAFRIYTMTNSTTFSYAGSTGSGVYVWGAQVEAGAFPTSYIPTTTTSLTRNADVVSMTGTNFSDWYNATEGTIVASFRMPVATGTTRRAISINDGTTNDTIQIALVNSSNQAYVEIRDNLSVQVTATVGSVFAVGTPVTAALAYKTNSFAYAAFGEATGTDTSGTVPTVSQMEIGSQLGVYFNGWVSKINYYPLRLTNAEVRAVSK